MPDQAIILLRCYFVLHIIFEKNNVIQKVLVFVYSYPMWYDRIAYLQSQRWDSENIVFVKIPKMQKAGDVELFLETFFFFVQILTEVYYNYMSVFV